MEAKKSFKVFRYQTDVFWKSGRRGVLSATGKPDLEISSPPEFKGEPGFWTPEDMFVASVNLCTLLTFVAFAQSKGLNIVAYESASEGVLENVEGKYRFTEICLRPQLTLESQQDLERARAILDSAQKACLVSNSITAVVKILPDFRVIAAAAA